METLKNKKILILGLARSGVGAIHLLHHFGCKIIVSDIKTETELQSLLTLIPEGIELYLGGHPMSILEDIDLIVLSPGIPLQIPFLQEAQKRAISIVSEVEIAYRALMYFKNNMPFFDFLFLAITGTNGKSTTTTLLHEILRASNYNSIIAGNIGNSICSEVTNLIKSSHTYEELQIYMFVTELSSFQLETMYDFKPYGSTILNITPDHLDRYKSMDDYIKAKCRIFQRQTEEDFLILNRDDPYIYQIIDYLPKGNRPHIFFFSRKNPVEGAFYNDGVIRFQIPYKKLNNLMVFVDHEIINMEISTSDLLLKGVHNIENIMAASLMAILSGCRRESIEMVLKNFKGLEHRLEFVREIDGVEYINDSKGTNIGAVMKSLEGFKNPVILIAGGRDKSSDFTLLRPYVKDRVKALILIGESAQKIAKALDGTCDIYFSDSLESAVQKSQELATKGDTVLLSPACASFDMFKNFEDRGRQFKEIVSSL
ncbi:MAG: UDP-N-acetylmuramoyl-L-alanine--D-glutamate ligase [Thermodesulfovibrionales bacterium]|nr:UDP-N-acetylmuramoyl-L-alanine--D-glutamate ligase [Thermodesulfovibrionales bacterium]